MFVRVCLAVLAFLLLTAKPVLSAESPYLVGFGKADITPTQPLRLSGYGNRTESSAGVDESLFVRAMAFKTPDVESLHVIVSVDTIGVAGELTKSIHQRVSREHDVPRSQFVLCCTHSHTAPQIIGALTNLFAKPLSDNERRDLEEYKQRLADQTVAAVKAAINNLKPGRLFVGSGEATFADNRRVIKDGIWTGFGVMPGGAVDHSLPILKITDATGEQVRGVIFNYACHCTTFGSNYNRINGDWAGYAAKYIEETYPDSTALCTIGCGADANPERDPDRDLQIAQAQGRQIADEVQSLSIGDMTELTATPQAAFGFAGLPSERPARDELQELLNDNTPQVRRHAENMLDTLKRMGRLPETYPMPIQTFRFGDEFSMVFLGGEVCVDYAFRIKQELGQEGQPPVWVTAYANDVFGYVAPERMQSEGGYEVDYSMIYYNLPGRWSSGTEDLILNRVHELYENRGEIGPVSPEESLNLLTVPDGFAVDLIAAEPLIRDPVNFALGADGTLWVVEMGDYPRGDPDNAGTKPANDAHPEDSPPGGQVKRLTDSDGDGRFDKATTFLRELKFPAGIFPWRDGVIVVAAPEILFARDTNGDGIADERRPLFTGFREGNPQHRISGVSYGLDGWLYLSGGNYNGEINSTITGEVTNVTGRDVRIHPDKGLIQPLSGQSQYGRCRDDWGNWFGNTNSEPLFHFAIEDPYLQRNPFVPSPEPRVLVTDPPLIPPVFPTSRTVDRFNDLHTSNRFTSACAPVIVRDERLGDDFSNATLICEPVHNLVSRVMLENDGITYTAHRHVNEQASEFLSSKDNWFRPVWVQNGPDASLWVCDMYRAVIEHPKWIPESWQAKLDLYAGHDKGRLYRLRRSDSPLTAPPNLAKMSNAELVDQLQSENGWRRDTAQRLLIERADTSVTESLESLAQTHPRPAVRVQALATLAALDSLTPDSLTKSFADNDPRVVRMATQIAESHIDNPVVLQSLCTMSDHEDLRVRYQLALTLGESHDPLAAKTLLELALRDANNPWMHAAVLSSAVPHGSTLLSELLSRTDDVPKQIDLLQSLIATTLGEDISGGLPRVVSMIVSPQTTAAAVQEWQIATIASCIEAVRRRGEQWAEVSAVAGKDGQTASQLASPVFAAARRIAANESGNIDRRMLAVQLLGQEAGSLEQDTAFLSNLVSPRVAVSLQQAAIHSLAAGNAKNLASRLLSGWSSHTPSIRIEILSTLLSRREWTDQLIDALAAGNLSVGDLDASTRNQLQERVQRTERDDVTALFSSIGSGQRAEVFATYQPTLSLEGQADRGAVLFKKTCSTCHKHRDIGNDLGPRLANLKNKSPEALLTAILDPNQAVEDKYRGYIVLTSDGRTVNGLLESETASSITLVEPNGKEHVLLRIDIDEMTSTGKSFMPEGLENDLSPQDLADVISFVASEQ